MPSSGYDVLKEIESDLSEVDERIDHLKDMKEMKQEEIEEHKQDLLNHVKEEDALSEVDYEFLKKLFEDKEFLGKIWQGNQNILGHARKLREDLNSSVIMVTHPLGKEMFKMLNVLIESQEQKLEQIEDRIDQYEEILDED